MELLVNTDLNSDGAGVAAGAANAAGAATAMAPVSPRPAGSAATPSNGQSSMQSRLLKPLATEVPTVDPTVRIGLARATLLLEPRSAAALQAAADDLASIQESQVPEATYTIALLRLAPALVARHGTAAGLEALIRPPDTRSGAPVRCCRRAG